MANSQKLFSHLFVRNLSCKGEWKPKELTKPSSQNSYLLLSGRDHAGMTLTKKEMVEELKIQWKRLWQERVNDKLRAESMATADYCDLFVEKGTVIHAARDFKALNFEEVLEQHQVDNTYLYIPADPKFGGWKKFIKTSITKPQPKRRIRVEPQIEEKREKQHPKKGGRGWLHKH
jgi:hypothetical protein